MTREHAMIRIKGRYRQQAVELDHPLNLADGTEVEIIVEPRAESEAARERDDVSALGMERLEAEWDNPGDAIYDDWKRLYGVEPR
jgi:hypothetical protein